MSPWDDEDGLTGADLLDRETGHPRVLSEQCSTCVGRPGNLMHLREGKLKELVQSNCGPHSLGLICHQTLPYAGNEPGFQPALCRWFYDTYGHRANGIRVFARLGGFTEVSPPGEEDDGDPDARADGTAADPDPGRRRQAARRARRAPGGAGPAA